MRLLLRKGGSGSGDFGHSGRPGLVGGSEEQGSRQAKKEAASKAKDIEDKKAAWKAKKADEQAKAAAEQKAKDDAEKAQIDKIKAEKDKKKADAAAKVKSEKKVIPDKKKSDKDILNSGSLADVEGSIRNNPTETAYVFNADGKPVWHNGGNVNSVDVSEAAGKGLLKGCTFTHNHPGDSSFSPQDLQVFMKFGVAEMRAVGKNTTYSATCKNTFTISDVANMINDWNTEDSSLRKVFGARINSGKMTIDEANYEHNHVIVGKICEKYGIKYTRTNKGV